MTDPCYYYDCPKCGKGTLQRWSGTDMAECDNCDYEEPKNGFVWYDEGKRAEGDVNFGGG